MWPLCDASPSDEAKEEAKEEARWRDGGGRVYFNEFKTLWARSHSACLRVLPPMDGQDEGMIQRMKTRLRDEAVVVLQAAISSEQQSADFVIVEDTKAESVWERITPTKRISVPATDKNKICHPVHQRRRRNTTVISLCDVLQRMDRQDRRREQTVLRRLQGEGRRLAREQAQDPLSLPECPNVWSRNIQVQRVPDSDEQQRYSSSVMKHDLHPVRRIEVECQTGRGSAINNPWSRLAEQAMQQLEAITARHASTLATDEVTARSHFDFALPCSREGRDVFSFPASAPIVEVTGGTDTKTSPLRPKLVKFDGLLKGYASETSVSAMATTIFKNVVKKNMGISLACAIPETILNEGKFLLRRAALASNHGDHSDIVAYGRARLLPLPPEISKHDDGRVETAHVALQHQAQAAGKSIPAPSISLTSLSLRLPSLWRHGITEAVVRENMTRLFTFPDTLSVGGDAPGNQRLQASKEPLPTPGNLTTQSNKGAQARETIMPANPPAARHENSAGSRIAGDETTESALPRSMKTRNSVCFKIKEDASTEDLVASFLHDEPDRQDSQLAARSAAKQSNSDANAELKVRLTIDQLARPALWFLVRLKLVKVLSSSMLDALMSIRLEVLETIVFQLHTQLRDLSANPSKMSAESIVEVCSAFRHTLWLHILRMIVECQGHSMEAALRVTSRILRSPVYRTAIGVKQISTIENLCVLMGGAPGGLSRQDMQVSCPIVESTPPSEPTEEPPRKKSRQVLAQQDKQPVRVICDVRLLERDELLEALSDLNISVVERELSNAIDLIIDEHNAVVLLGPDHFDEEHLMRALTYELASSQVQFEKLWIVTDGVKNESSLHFFYAALANFAVGVQTFVCQGELEVSEVLRGIIDFCAESALSHHRILPKMWFARPFILEEESQLERFLSSTKIVNAYAAQSVLHRLSIEDLMNKSLEEATHLIGCSLSGNQVDLLLRLLRTSHGIGM